MKRLYLLIIVIAYFQTSYSQWIPVEGGEQNQLWDVHFVNDTLGMIVGDAIIKTVNGGLTWSSTNSVIADTRYYGVHIKDTLTMWAVGKKKTSSTAGRIHYTTDGGLTWQVYLTGTVNLPWWSVDFADDGLHGIIVGQEGQALFTTDGGLNWFKRTLPSGNAGIIKDVTFYDGLNAIAVGYDAGSGVIMKTINGGSSWTNVVTNLDGQLSSVSFSDSQNGLAVGSGGRIYKTSDGGNNWALKLTGLNTLNSVHFYNKDRALSVGNGGDVFVTNDGGANWEFQDSGTTYTLRGVFKNNNSTAFATGVLGTIIKDNCAQSGTVSFVDNMAAPLIAPDLTTESKIYFYYNVLEDENVPPLCTIVEKYLTIGGYSFLVGARYLGNGLLQMWFDFTNDSITKQIAVSLPETITQDGITISLENLPSSFNIDLKSRADKKESISVFAGLSVGLSLLEGGVGVGGASVALSKQSLTGSGGMGLKFEYDLSGEQIITRTFNVSAGLSVELPSIGSAVPNVVETPQAEVKISGSFGQSMKFLDNTDTTKKAKAAYLIESFGLGGIPLNPFAGVYIIALKNALVDLNPDITGLYSTYHHSNIYGAGAEGNISTGYNFKFGETEFDFLQAGLNTSLSLSLESFIKEQKKSLNVSLAGAFDLSALDLKIFNDKVDFGKQLNFNFGGEIGVAGDYDTQKGVIDKLSLSYKSNESAEVSILQRSISRKYEFIIPGSVISSNSGADNLIGVASDLITLGESNKTFKTGVDYFTSSLDEIYSANPQSLGNYSEYNQLDISESDLIGIKDKIGIDLGVTIGVGVGVSLGFEYGYFSESEYLKSESIVVNDTILPTFENARNLDDLITLKGEITNLLEGTTLLLDGAFDELMSVVEQPIQDGVAFIVNIGNSTVELTGALVSDGEKWLLRWLDPSYNTIFSKAESFKSEVKLAYVSREVSGKTSKNSDSKFSSIVNTSTLYIISNNLNVNLLDVNDNPIETFDPVTLSIPIDQAKVDELEFTDAEKALAKMYVYDEVNLVWEEVAGDDDVDINIVATQITKAGNYAIGIAYDTASDSSAPDIQDHYPKEGNIIPPSDQHWATLYEPITGAGIDLSQTIIKLDGVEVAASWDPVNDKILYTPETPLADGAHTFEVIVKDLNGNTNSIFSNFTVDSALSTEDVLDIDAFKIYPNPTKNLLHIKGNISKLNAVSIYNALGQHIMSIGSDFKQIDLNNLKPALYFVKLSTNQGERVFKIIKE